MCLLNFLYRSRLFPRVDPMQNRLSLFQKQIDKQFCFHKSASVTLQLFESLFEQNENISHCKLETDGRYENVFLFLFFCFFCITLSSGRKVTLSRLVTEVFIVKYHVISSAPKFENNEEKLMRIEIDRGSLLLTYLSLFSSAVDV